MYFDTKSVVYTVKKKESIMADRNWNLLNSLGYLYNAFAVYTDLDLDEA